MRARLINPELVTVLPVARSGQQEDALGGEPYARLPRGAQIQLRAQVDERNRNRRQPDQGGAEVHHAATLTFLRTAVEAASWIPTDGDRVVAVADRNGGSSRTVNWYVVNAQLLAKERARAKLVVVEVSDRGPSRRQVEGL